MDKTDRPRRFGIQARVLALAVLFTLLAAVIVTASSVRSVSAQLRRAAFQSAEYAVQTAADGIRQDILEIDALPNWCAINYTVRTALFSDSSAGALAHSAYPFISNRYGAMRTSLYIQRFLLITSSGRTIMLGTASSLSKQVSSENANQFPGLGEGDGPVEWDRLADDPLMQSGPRVTGIPIARSISSGSAMAQVYLSVSPDLITDALKGVDGSDGSWLCWIMGGVMYRVEGGSLVELGPSDRLPPPSQEGEYTLDAGTLLYSAQFDGEDCSMVACPLGVHDLYLAKVIPEAALAQPLSLLLSSVLTTLAVLLVMGLVTAALLHRTVAAPIGALQRRIEAVSHGDFTQDPSIEWNHELGDVGRGINGLSRSVSALMDKRIEDEKQRLDLEYRMLQNQISPHFIYNTLNSIKWMATIQHAPGVAEMVTALSRLLKSVSKGTRRLVPLEEEFSLLEDYFTIQRYRYGGTITMEIHPPEDEELLHTCLIPRFTLQPLVENAIFHGIEPNGGVGRVEIGVERPEEGGVLIRLSDDGVGMAQEQIDHILASPQAEGGEDAPFRHVGVWNVHRLLQLSFGPGYGLVMESEPGCGTEIGIRLPGGRRPPGPSFARRANDVPGQPETAGKE